MDLGQHPPRRWSETLAGMIWLPRLIDKVRAFQAGTLGNLRLSVGTRSIFHAPIPTHTGLYRTPD